MGGNHARPADVLLDPCYQRLGGAHDHLDSVTAKHLFVAMKAQYILTNWKPRVGYIVVSVCLGALIGAVAEDSIPLWVGMCVCVALLRIWAEIRQREKQGPR